MVGDIASDAGVICNELQASLSMLRAGGRDELVV
jgi:hypothetical protein